MTASVQSAVVHNSPNDRDDDRDNCVVIRNASYWAFETILAARGDAPVPRIAYLNGEIELVSPSQIHEMTKKLFARLIEAYADSQGLTVEGRGSETLRRPEHEVGAEPDECYNLGDVGEFPDLVVEVVKRRMSDGINKFVLYSELGIPEFWRWVDGVFTVYHLRNSEYVEADKSLMFPKLDLALLRHLLTFESQSAAVRALREALAKRP